MHNQSLLQRVALPVLLSLISWTANAEVVTDGRKIAATAGKFKKNTSVGLDLWAIKEITQCDHEDLDKLAGLYRECDIEVTAPAQ